MQVVCAKIPRTRAFLHKRMGGISLWRKVKTFDIRSIIYNAQQSSYTHSSRSETGKYR